MGERTAYRPGTFCWVELSTTDAKAAKEFYGALLGWDLEDASTGTGTYTLARVGSGHVAGLYERADGAPAWLSYVSVEDAEATARRAAELGATVLAETFDVLDAGRMAVLQDPTGAVVALWQPKATIGATLVNDPGAMVLSQLNTTDPDTAQSFYGGLFGWTTQVTGTEEQPYWGLFNEGALNGGMMPIPPDATGPSHWLVYFTTSDLDAAVIRISELGGRVLVPALAIQSGRIAVALDPQGAAFALFEGGVDP